MQKGGRPERALSKYCTKKDYRSLVKRSLKNMFIKSLVHYLSIWRMGALLRCKQEFCLAGITLNGNKIDPGTVVNELRELLSEHPSTQWIFLIEFV